MASHDESFAPIPVGSHDDAGLKAYLKEHGLTLAAERGPPGGRTPGPRPHPDRDDPVRHHVERALLLQEQPPPPEGQPADRRRATWWSVRSRTRASSTSASIDGRSYGIIFAHESHNHPSQVMPVEGAATGIGGIVRDVYCMGGEVIATLDPLRFGWPADRNRDDDGRTRPTAWRSPARWSPASGSTATPSACPTWAATSTSIPVFNENCLVNVVAVGLVDHDAHHPQRRAARRPRTNPTT